MRQARAIWLKLNVREADIKLNKAGKDHDTLVENERLVTKKMTKIRISMTTFGLAIAGG